MTKKGGLSAGGEGRPFRPRAKRYSVTLKRFHPVQAP